MAELLTPDICVIGGGAGGLAVAIEARSHGASVVLVERGRLGGEALNSASLPSKALVAAARRAHQMRTASAFGLANDQPRINARGVFDHVHEVIDGIAPTVSADHLAARGIELVAAGPEALVGALEMACTLGPLDALIERIEAVEEPGVVSAGVELR